MEKNIVRQFGEHIRNLRIKHELTQEELAGKSHISLKYIQRIEGKIPPNVGLEYLQKLADGFDMPVSELLEFK